MKHPVRLRTQDCAMDVWLFWRLQVSFTRTATFATVTVRINRSTR